MYYTKKSAHTDAHNICIILHTYTHCIHIYQGAFDFDVLKVIDALAGVLLNAPNSEPSREYINIVSFQMVHRLLELFTPRGNMKLDDKVS